MLILTLAKVDLTHTLNQPKLDGHQDTQSQLFQKLSQMDQLKPFPHTPELPQMVDQSLTMTLLPQTEEPQPRLFQLPELPMVELLPMFQVLLQTVDTLLQLKSHQAAHHTFQPHTQNQLLEVEALLTHSFQPHQDMKLLPIRLNTLHMEQLKL